MHPSIHVAILEDHQSTIDGYLYRFQSSPEIQVVATAGLAEELDPMLAEHAVDVLILDANVPISAGSNDPFPILYEIPRLRALYENLHIMVISMHSQRTLIKAVMNAGASGYLLKDDCESIRNLPDIIRTVAAGGIYLSTQAMQQCLKSSSESASLTVRQKEMLSLCAAYPCETTADLAKRMNVAKSTARNLLSDLYLKLGVHNRSAALGKARKLGIVLEVEKPAGSQLVQQSVSKYTDSTRL